MRLFLSIFLLFSIVTSVTLSAVQQISKETVCEYNEGKSDGKEDSTEKESFLEKDLLTCETPEIVSNEYGLSFTSMIHNHIYDGDLIHSLYSSLPCNPPE